METWLRDHADETVLRWLFCGLLAVTMTVLVLDYAELQARGSDEISVSSPSAPKEGLPAARPGSDEPGFPFTKQDATLKGRMTFELVGDGKLLATGTVEPGSAKEFAAEVEKRGAYVKTIVLHSPGGSVDDALAMGRLIRARGFATQVEAGRYCASSCPLIFAGGVERRAGAKARIGVHQVAAYGKTGVSASEGMESVQRVSAECQRYLREMGIDLQVWMHAMDTPKEKLFYFKPEETLALKLATAHEGAKPAPVAKART